MRKKKAVVPATKQKSPEFIESFISSSGIAYDSVTQLAASRNSILSRGKKAELPRPAIARLSSSPSASRASLPTRALADMGSTARAALSSDSASKVRRAADVATNPMTLPLYVLVVERKQANRALTPKYFKAREELFRLVQPGSTILVNSGMTAVSGNGAPVLRDLSRELREILLSSCKGASVLAYTNCAVVKLVVPFSRWFFRTYGPRYATSEERAAYNFIRNLPAKMIVDKRLEVKAGKEIGKSAMWLDKSDDNLLFPQDFQERLRLGLPLTEDLNSRLLV